MKVIYMDNAASTFVDPQVKEMMDIYSTEEFGNPGSTNNAGKIAKQAIEQARRKVSYMLNCNPDEIVFTSGGTESINLALQGVAKAHKRGHIITTKVEHYAVLNTCKFLEKEGFTVTYLDSDKYGMVNINEVKSAIRADTFLISIIYANNEIGTINPINEIGTLLKNYPNIHFHTDACQAGTLNINVNALGTHLLTLNGSKIYGPKGSGILYVKKDTPIQQLFHGGNQEHRLRSGTENVPAIMGFAAALEIAQSESNSTILRDKLITGLLTVPHSSLNGHPTQRLPNNVNISIENVDAETLVQHLSQQGIHAATGSACTSQNIEPSHVLKAIGLSDEHARCSVRFTLGRKTTEADINTVIKALPQIIESLRKLSVIEVTK